MSVLNTNVLVLNRSFFPVHITTVKRAFCLLVAGVAKAVDEEYRTYDFKSWAELAPYKEDRDVIGLVGRKILVPRVIQLLNYDKIPPRKVKFNRYNIFLRDNNTCQYCGKKLPKSELNIDHVIPRSRGGKTTWDNVVCCCISCNRKKGGRLPEEAGMKLIKKPTEPKWSFSLFVPRSKMYREWVPFLRVVDSSYWSVELEQDS